jgi:hypothetical protein
MSGLPGKAGTQKTRKAGDYNFGAAGLAEETDQKGRTS